MFHTEPLGIFDRFPEFSLLQHGKKGVEIASHIVIHLITDEAAGLFFLHPFQQTVWFLLGSLLPEEALFRWQLVMIQFPLQFHQKTGIIGLHDQRTPQRVSVTIHHVKVMTAETLPVGDGPDLRLHIAGAGADGIVDSPVLRVPLQIAERAFVPGGKRIVNGDRIQFFPHKCHLRRSFFPVLPCDR